MCPYLCAGKTIVALLLMLLIPVLLAVFGSKLVVFGSKLVVLDADGHAVQRGVPPLRFLPLRGQISDIASYHVFADERMLARSSIWWARKTSEPSKDRARDGRQSKNKKLAFWLDRCRIVTAGGMVLPAQPRSYT